MKKLLIESTSLDELMGRIRKVMKEVESKNTIGSQSKEELWTRTETKNFFQVSFQTLHNWKKHKVLVPLNVGTRVYYRKSDIDEILSKKGGRYEN